jgi:hypothetical protein
VCSCQSENSFLLLVVDTFMAALGLLAAFKYCPACCRAAWCPESCVAACFVYAGIGTDEQLFSLLVLMYHKSFGACWLRSSSVQPSWQRLC